MGDRGPTMTDEERGLQRVVEAAAHRAAARSPWADIDDLRQEAWVAVLEARRTWDPGRGTRVEAYARTAAVRRLGQYLWRMSRPVTGPLRNGRRLRGVRGYPITDPTNTYDSDRQTNRKWPAVEFRRRLSHPLPDVDMDAGREAWWARLRWHVRRAVRPGDWEVAVRILKLRGHPRERARDVARDLGWPLSRVHRTSSRVRRTVARDPLIQEEWAEGAHA